MRKSYVKYPMPYEAWKNFKDKQAKINETYKELTGKNKIIPLSKIILASSRKPIFFENNEILGITRRKKR